MDIVRICYVEKDNVKGIGVITPLLYFVYIYFYKTRIMKLIDISEL